MANTLNVMEDSSINSDLKQPAITIDTVTIITNTTTAATTSSHIPSATFTTTKHNDDGETFSTSERSFSSNHYKQQNHQPRCTTKILQQKLEARIEQAKRIQLSNTEYIGITGNSCKKASMISVKSTGLIPIQRLHSPLHDESLTHHERYPLVQYWQSDTSDSEDETTIFPLSRGNQNNFSNHKQDLTDTFSIQESSGESEDSLNLMVPTCHQTSHLHVRNFTRIGCCNCLCRII